MSVFRSAAKAEYRLWLAKWINAGRQPTHFYDRPWNSNGWWVANRDFRLGGECGAEAVEIIVPVGVRWLSGALGHNNLYFMDGPSCKGSVVPVFCDDDFLAMPGVREFVEVERRREAQRQWEYDAWRAARKASNSDVPSRWTGATG